ncbi:MAG: hypothetical protein V1913_09910 [Fibrobacterota bacterium]
MKQASLLILALCYSALSGAVLNKESLSLEYGKKYDSNIILPDSATGKSALVSNLAVRPALLLQLNPSTMLRSEVELSAEEEDAFPDNAVMRAGVTLTGRHLLSHLTMAGFHAAAQKSVSDNRYYATEDVRMALTLGRYLDPLTNLEANLTGSQKTFPTLYRNSITDRAKRSYYYDYREFEAELTGNRLQSDWLTLFAELNGTCRDYYNDTHDSDYVGYRPVINYINIGGDTVYYSPEDTAIPLYAPNIHQKDQSLTFSLSASLTPLSGFTLTPRFTARALFSNDAYFNARTYSAGLFLRWRRAASSIRANYDILQDRYPDRPNDDDGRIETMQTAGLTYGYNVTADLQLQCSYVLRSFNSTADFDDYIKKVIGVSLSWSR